MMQIAAALLCLAASTSAQQQPAIRGGGGRKLSTDRPRSLQDTDDDPIVTNPSCNGAPFIFDGDADPLGFRMSDSINCGNGTALTITTPGVTLDCRGYNLRRDHALISNRKGVVTGAGIRVEAENVTIRNCNILRFSNGIVVDNIDTDETNETSSIAPVVVESVAVAGSTANGLKSFGNVTVSGSMFTGNGRTGVSIMEGSATISTSGMNANGGVGAYVNDGAQVGFFNVQFNENGDPQVWGQGVGLTVAQESTTTVFQSEVCGNRDGPFRIVVPEEGAAAGTIQVEIITCDLDQYCAFECDAVEFFRSATP